MAANVAADDAQIRLEAVFPLGTRALSTMLSGWWLRRRWADGTGTTLNNIIHAKRGGGPGLPQHRNVSRPGLEFMLVPVLITAGPGLTQYRNVS